MQRAAQAFQRIDVRRSFNADEDFHSAVSHKAECRSNALENIDAGLNARLLIQVARDVTDAVCRQFGREAWAVRGQDDLATVIPGQRLEGFDQDLLVVGVLGGLGFFDRVDDAACFIAAGEAPFGCGFEETDEDQPADAAAAELWTCPGNPQASVQHQPRHGPITIAADGLLPRLWRRVLAEGPAAGFDAVVSWLVFLHLPDRQEAVKRMRRALKPRGMVYIEDFFEKAPLKPGEWADLRREVWAKDLPSMDEWVAQFETAGFRDIRPVDMTPQWGPFVEDRFAKFRAARERNLRVHGAHVTDALDIFYATMNRLFKGGNLGGIRMIARAP